MRPSRQPRSLVAQCVLSQQETSSDQSAVRSGLQKNWATTNRSEPRPTGQKDVIARPRSTSNRDREDVVEPPRWGSRPSLGESRSCRVPRSSHRQSYPSKPRRHYQSLHRAQHHAQEATSADPVAPLRPRNRDLRSNLPQERSRPRKASIGRTPTGFRGLIGRGIRSKRGRWEKSTPGERPRDWEPAPEQGSSARPNFSSRIDTLRSPEFLSISLSTRFGRQLKLHKRYDPRGHEQWIFDTGY